MKSDNNFKTEYTLFPGIHLSFCSVQTDDLFPDTQADESVIQIHYCEDGKIENFTKDTSFSLTPGDLSIALPDNTATRYHFPLHHYQGITITIHTDTVTNTPSHFFDTLCLHPLKIVNQLCNDNGYHIIRNQQNIERILGELHSSPEAFRISFLRLKVAELFLVLSSIDTDHTSHTSLGISTAQKTLAKRVADYINDASENNFSVELLSRKFHVSQTHLQNAFKGVYGVTVFSYIRSKKIRTAASKLLQSEVPIIEIANEVGYENPSKFASAFKEIMGQTPLEYRREHGPSL